MIDYYNNETRLTEILRAVVNSSTIDLGPARTREEIFVSRAFGLTMWPAIPPRTTLEMWLAFIAGDAAEPAAGTYTVRTCAESCIITYARRVRGASAVVPIFVPHTHYELALAKLAGIVPLNWGVLGREWEYLMQTITVSTMPRSAVAVIGGERVGIGPGGEITPFQYLHGYDHPWPGGGGKNKLYNGAASTYTTNGITFTKNSDGSVTANGTATSDAQYYIDVGTLSGDFYFVCIYGQPSYSTVNAFMWDTTTNARCKQWDGSTASLSSYNGTLLQAQLVSGHVNRMSLRVMSGKTVSNFTFYPMICASTETDATFAPYSNICPIYPGLTLVRDDESALEVWGGALDAAKDKLTVTDAEIASYAGESLPGEWISDRDAYAAGAVPTTGAQVVYKLAEPLTYQLTRAEVQRSLNCAQYLGAGVWRLNCAGATIIRARIHTESPTNHYDLAASSEDWSFTIAVDGTTAAGGSGIISVAAGDHDVVIVATPGDGAGVCIIHPTLYYTAVAGLLGSRRDMEEAVEPEEPEEPAEPEPEEPAEPEPVEPEPEEPAEPEEPQEPKEPKEPVEPEEPQTTKRRRKK